jgi:ATP-dependent Lon protease
MAVLKVSGNSRATILCLAGPPGVGKTSLGQSIADATGRPFVRIALGGVRDEAEIRGHRRTYVGALPGRLIHAMKKAGKKNPVILLDEIDKLGQGWMGSPEAALLEVLDPEQNKTFTDHYMELPFDLSEVPSSSPPTASRRCRPRCATASRSSRSPATPPTRSCTSPRSTCCPQLGRHAIAEGTLTVTDDAMRAVIRDYTREAGVRQLERELTKLCRALTLEFARSSDEKQAPASRSTRTTCTSTSARSGSSARSPSAPPSPAWRPAWRGRRSAATSCSSRPRGCPARATSRSPGSSAT